MKDQSSYAPAVKAEFVDIPQQVITFFRQRDRYIPLPQKGESGVVVSYGTIKGKNPEEVPPIYYNDEKLMKVERYPFANKDSISQEEADISAITALKAMFGRGQYGRIQRAYMINTGTVPIEVRFGENGKGPKRKVYVKRPDTNRIIGKSFYDIISGVGSTGWKFNRAVFIEEEIHGRPLSQLDERTFIHDPRYREGLARAIVHADFLQMYHDVRNPRNRIIDSDLKTVLFDFNLIFGRASICGGDSLLQSHMEKHGALDNKMFDAFDDEKKQVAKRLDREHKLVEKLAMLTGGLIDYSQKTLDERLREWYKLRNLQEYIEKKIEEYKFDD